MRVCLEATVRHTTERLGMQFSPPNIYLHFAGGFIAQGHRADGACIFRNAGTQSVGQRKKEIPTLQQKQSVIISVNDGVSLPYDTVFIWRRKKKHECFRK